MKDLQPVIDIVKNRIANGESAERLRTELTEKGYTKEQSEIIFNTVSELNVSEKKPRNRFGVIAIVICVLAFVLSIITLLDYKIGEPRPAKDTEMPELVDTSNKALEEPEKLTLSSGQSMLMYELTTETTDAYQAPNKYHIHPNAIDVIDNQLSILFDIGLNVLMLDGKPEECHLRDRYSIKKVLPMGDSYVLEAYDSAARKTRIFYGCIELGTEYQSVWDPVVVNGKVGFLGSHYSHPDKKSFKGTFNFAGKEYGNDIGEVSNVFVLNDEVVFVAHSEAYRGNKYLYKGNEVIVSAMYADGVRVLHPFKTDNKLGYVLETTSTLEYVFDGEIIFEHRKANTRDNLFIDLKFSDNEGYIAMQKPNRVLYFSNGTYKPLDQIDSYVRPVDWNHPENNQTSGVVTFALQRGGKTLFYRGSEIIHTTDKTLRTNTITFSEAGDFAYTFDGNLYLNGTRLAGQFDKNPSSHLDTFAFQDSTLFFSSSAPDTYAGEIFSIREKIEHPQTSVYVHPYIIEEYPLFYVVKNYGHQRGDVPPSHFLIYDENAPWASVVEKTVENIQLLKE